jgi:Tol biopolymer transport system component
VKTLPIAVAIFLVLLVGGVSYFEFTRASPYPIPTPIANVAVPQSKPYRQLTSGSWNDRWPAWSPDGKAIAYVSDRGGLWSIWVMNANGSAARQLSPTGAIATNPSWSPDSFRLAYWCLEGSSASIRIVTLSNSSTITLTGDEIMAVRGPVKWSPDSSHLLFYLMDSDTHLAVADVRTRTTRTLADVSGDLLSADWADPDRVLFTNEVGGRYEIDWADVNGRTTGVLLQGDNNFMSPAVSPNETLVSYYSDLIPQVNGTQFQLGGGYGGYNIWICRHDGENAIFQFVWTPDQYRSAIFVPMPYTAGDIDYSTPPSWSSNGKKLAYSSHASSTGFGVYVWDTGNWSISRVGPYGGDELDPTWSPDDVNVAFSCNIGGYFHIWVVDTTGAGGVGGPVSGY